MCNVSKDDLHDMTRNHPWALDTPTTRTHPRSRFVLAWF